ncbi:hypothetical protein E4U43_007393 [Claviceps pusilla]|uniref:Uncharacterized protein n=1 Tax=Claviceps pusilla TaxID=123648 RepID=A0A9P7NIR7_9HYPO|nr:hypothetical protein E4U43_007393 [Claviceps pusilla]
MMAARNDPGRDMVQSPACFIVETRWVFTMFAPAIEDKICFKVESTPAGSQLIAASPGGAPWCRPGAALQEREEVETREA